jgi:hypothetical protein
MAVLFVVAPVAAQPPYYPYPPPVLYAVEGPPPEGSARLQVKPGNAEVYVDGYLAGTVSSFDGFAQRLHVAPGQHTLAFFLDGYRTAAQKVDFKPHTTLNIKFDLAKLSAGETSGPRPQPTAQSTPPSEQRALPQERPSQLPPPVRPRSSEYGTLTIRVQPAGATVAVDGQEWENSGPGPLSIELAEGPHDIEVRQNGYASFRRTVQIHPGDMTTLNVSLSR